MVLKKLRWAGHVARMEEGRSTPTGKRTIGRPRRRWEDNIITDLKEMGINKRNCIDSAQERDCWRADVNAALNLVVP